MENWLSKLERKFGRYAIPNLMYYIIILYAAGFVLNIVNPEFYYRYLSLNAQAILHGQVWRIVTFIIQPPSSSLVFIVFALYLYYMIGQELENAWGAFRFNLYFFSGMLFHVAAAMLLYVFTGMVLPMSVWYLNMSLFFAFAALFSMSISGPLNSLLKNPIIFSSMIFNIDSIQSHTSLQVPNAPKATNRFVVHSPV